MKIDTVDFKKLQKELKVIDNQELVEKINLLYENYKNLTSNKDVEIKGLNNMIKEIIEDLFKNQYLQQEVFIPLTFLDTEIGKVLFTLKYSNAEKVYGSTEVAEMLGCTLQNINKLVKSGTLKAEKRSGRMYFLESDVMDYMERKGKL